MASPSEGGQLTSAYHTYRVDATSSASGDAKVEDKVESMYVMVVLALILEPLPV